MPSPKANSYNSANQESKTNAVLDELIIIRRLLVILLTKLGSDSGEIGDALGLEPRRIREWVSFKGITQMSEKTDKKADKGKKQASKKTSIKEDKRTELATEVSNKE